MFTSNHYRAKANEYVSLVSTSATPQEAHEYQQLQQSFDALANNEQWLADNDQKTLRSHEKEQSCSVILAEEEENILRYLGAALIMQWNTLPAKLQRELFDNADSMGELLETASLRGQIAPFLHKHKNKIITNNRAAT